MTSKQIKQVLVQLAAEDKLPLDMNDLDESVFNDQMRTTREHILSLPEKIRKLIPEKKWINDYSLEPNPISAVYGICAVPDEVFEYLWSIVPFGHINDHVSIYPEYTKPEYIWSL